MKLSKPFERVIHILHHMRLVKYFVKYGSVTTTKMIQGNNAGEQGSALPKRNI
jgi:hypothetical protein